MQNKEAVATRLFNIFKLLKASICGIKNEIS
jgi:hypothetical protein